MTCHALAKVKGEAWISSFKKVNMHPDHRRSFTKWQEEIKDKLVAGQRFFVPHNCLWDAMPQFWKVMTPDARRSLCTMIDGFYADAEITDESPWGRRNLKDPRVAGVSFEDLPRLWTCYFATNEDKMVFEEPGPLHQETQDKMDEKRKNLIDDFEGFKLKPKSLLEEVKTSKL
jgi:hypothetical protein